MPTAQIGVYDADGSLLDLRTDLPAEGRAVTFEPPLTVPAGGIVAYLHSLFGARILNDGHPFPQALTFNTVG